MAERNFSEEIMAVCETDSSPEELPEENACLDLEGKNIWD